MAQIPNFDDLLDQLALQEYAIVDDFFEQRQYLALLSTAKAAYDGDAMRRAGIGKTDAYMIETAIRQDQIQWLSPQDPYPAIQTYFEVIDALRTGINQSFFLSLHDYEAHFAAYEKGGFYRKHRDQFRDTDARQISCVYFLNDQWQSDAAGELVMYHPTRTKVIEPIGNRFVCFRSHLLHEVLPTNALRLSLTGWIKKEVVPFV